MQFSTIIFALAGIALTSAAPATSPSSQSLAPRSSVEETLYVTFWKEGCFASGSGVQLTVRINDQDTPDKPGDCILNGNYGWQSINIQEPSSDKARYAIDLFSGLGCNNPILTVSENGCYTQPNGEMVQTFRARKL